MSDPAHVLLGEASPRPHWRFLGEGRDPLEADPAQVAGTQSSGGGRTGQQPTESCLCSRAFMTQLF